MNTKSYNEQKSLGDETMQICATNGRDSIGEAKSDKSKNKRCIIIRENGDANLARMAFINFPNGVL